MFKQFETPWEELIENKVELKRLKPGAKSLSYVTICQNEDSDSFIIAYFNFMGNPSLTKSFGDYIGLSVEENTPGRNIFHMYNEALSGEISRTIDRETWLNHPCKSRIN